MRPIGQYRAMVYGIGGTFGILSNVESESCSVLWTLQGSSPTSGTILESVIYGLSPFIACNADLRLGLRLTWLSSSIAGTAKNAKAAIPRIPDPASSRRGGAGGRGAPASSMHPALSEAHSAASNRQIRLG